MFENTFAPYPVTSATEALELHQVVVEFRQEVACRQAFESYCRWYAETAQAHRDELAAMQRDVPILDWFLGFRR